MTPLISKQRVEIWSRRIGSFWQEYSHNRVGLVGLVVVLIYVVVAIFAPWLTPYDPLTAEAVANGFAKPIWTTVLPENRYLPRTMILPMNWTVKEKGAFVNVTGSPQNLTVRYEGTGPASINLTASFMYPYDPPKRFRVQFTWWTEKLLDTEYLVDLYIINPAGNRFIFWASYQFRPDAPFTSQPERTTHEDIYSIALPLYIYERLGIEKGGNVAERVFPAEYSKGEYHLQLHVMFRPKSETGTMEVHFTNSELTILGLVHGILGTDNMGRDVFSQVIHGARISLAVGLFCAALATSAGIMVGIVAGYFGGVVDEATMRVVDILLCLPVLPLLLGLMVIFGASVWYLVILIAVFGWQGLSRIIRSRVLSLKEMPFVECARAAGASKFYIMLKHMVPNVLPVALASMILSVPSAILTEAAISFIGLGDPTAPTWGRMLHYAHSLGGFFKLAWWWIIPPGLAITVLTLCFVFIGHAVDEIVNPRLRRRR